MPSWCFASVAPGTEAVAAVGEEVAGVGLGVSTEEKGDNKKEQQQ
jgi:hypothetical protein